MADELETTAAEEEAAYLADLAKLNHQRAATYGLLARMYRVEIDREQLEAMRGMRFPAATGNEDSDKGFLMLARYLSRAWDNTITELAVDYVRVFIGSTNQLDGAAFPFESVYTSEKRLMMQDARDEVLAIYRAYGLSKDESWREGEDHIALELEFMKVLSERIAAALESGNEDTAYDLMVAQLNFLQDHLLSWAPLLTVDMRRFAKTDFYLALSYLTDGFLETDKEYLLDMLTEVEEDE
ncbi:TorD/DmsD family molecular chaperone [Slackia heliotrinireducens]|uniref:Uncharacterized component of anaerobic dehydrogenase n=1 Tax=Slackia heliotrinireducens (strain ATCC 29202 / DSM 20476 / NCTC 11029 / RHS 1) TaxID=471855 RepID=C7N168_SLAHD|nr:molecular chaperone TorD family protein [Slackia heliotrinireducens]ACV23290.1 uncharacterized component of anaerobic dehydrogenase [Slackia heliotrinireducens DSM 20476]VEH02468.1 Chaperone protein TorD [Slackia heliotrinireducens]